MTQKIKTQPLIQNVRNINWTQQKSRGWNTHQKIQNIWSLAKKKDA